MTRIVVAALLVALCFAAAYARNEVWQDRVGPWRDAAAKAPHNARAAYNLCFTLVAEAPRSDEALAACTRAAALAPGGYADHVLLQRVYAARGMREQARDELRTAIAIANRRPVP